MNKHASACISQALARQSAGPPSLPCSRGRCVPFVPIQLASWTQNDPPPISVSNEGVQYMPGK
jgi:hypothetical protein